MPGRLIRVRARCDDPACPRGTREGISHNWKIAQTAICIYLDVEAVFSGTDKALILTHADNREGYVASKATGLRTLIWFWGTSGAGVRFSHRIAVEIAARHGVGNVCLSVHSDNALIEACRAEGFVIREIDGPAGHRAFLPLLFSAPKRLMAFRRHLKDLRPDVVIVPMNFALAWPLAILAKLHGAALIYTVHDAIPHPGDYSPQFQTVFQRRLIRIASKLVTLSTAVKDLLLAKEPAIKPEAIEVVLLSSHVPRMRTRARKATGRPIKLLFLGRLLQYKGLNLLAQAMRKLAHRKDWMLSIAGNGPDREKVMADFADMQQVDLSQIKWLLEQEVDHAVASHDIIVCPYIEASQSGVLAEAQAYGMPAIVTPQGGLVEQIGFGSAGWTAQSSSVEDIAAMIEAVLDDCGSYEAKSAACLTMTAAAPGGTAWARIVEEAYERNSQGR